MMRDTIVAVKEPIFGSYLYGQNAVAVQQPTDTIRISKYDSMAKALFPKYKSPAFTDSSKDGDTAFTSGKIMDAVDIYTEGIQSLRQTLGSEGTSESLHALLLKRGFAYTRVDLHSKALMDFIEILIAAPTNRKALKLACISCLKLGKLQAAQCYSSGLYALTPTDVESQKICAKVSTRLDQANGKFNFRSLVEATKRGELDLDVSNFAGDIEVRQSALGGRGTFAKRALQAGQLLLCEKPIVAAYDTTKSSFGNGNEVDMYGIGRRWMSILQQLAITAIEDPRKARQLFNLHDGQNAYRDWGYKWKPEHGYDT